MTGNEAIVKDLLAFHVSEFSAPEPSCKTSQDVPTLSFFFSFFMINASLSFLFVHCIRVLVSCGCGRSHSGRHRFHQRRTFQRLSKD